MSNSKDIQNTIDAYLTGDLREQELLDFEKKLSEDTALLQEVNKQKAVQNLIIQHRLLDVKALAKKEEAKLKNRNNTLLKGVVTGLIGASILGAGVFYFQDEKEKTPTPSPSNLVEQKQEEKISSSVETKEITEQKTEQKKSAVKKENTTKTTVSEEGMNLVKVDSSAILDTKTKKENTEIVLKKDSNTLEKEPIITTTKTSVSAKKAITPCDTTELSISVTPIATCEGKQEGELILGKISGGKQPYKQVVKNAYGEELYTFTELKAGTYFISISDKNNCSTNFSPTIAEKNCPINDHFNPSLGQIWEIPTSEKNGKITIYARNGTTVYEQQVIAEEKATWDGFGNTGILPAGYYIFVIEYQNGSQTKGSITISE